MISKKLFVSCALILALFLQAAPVSEARTDMTQEDIDAILWAYTIDDSIPTYGAYRNMFDQNKPDRAYNIDASAFSRYLDGGVEAYPAVMSGYMGMDGDSVLTSENSVIEYDVFIDEPGWYDISLLYYPVEGKSSEIQRSFFIDGALPYRELALIHLPRIWQNARAALVTAPGYTPLVWEKDNQGNDLKPWMQESPEWVRKYLYDADGYITTRLPVYLSHGPHTITINSLREPLMLRQISLDNPPASESYAEVKAALDAAGVSATYGRMVRLQAQDAIRTSSQMLYPVQDSSSPALTPSSPKSLLNNTIGGNSWRFAGQWIEWDFTVPESGYYNIGFNVKQNFRRGAAISRKITINGEVPFAEMEDYGFVHSQNWRQETLTGGGEPFLFYLETGKVHTLRMEAVLGRFADIISEARNSIYDLNAIYRKVIRLTGAKPDRYRDYQIERSLPELNAELIAVRDKLNWIIDEIRRVSMKRGERERVLVTMRDQLDSLIKDCERFPRVLESFKVNVRACGTWLNESMLQPLQLDSIQIFSPDQKPVMRNNSFFHKAGFEITRLFYSFIIDYNRIGNISATDSGDTVTLWIGSGRDQANVIKSLIDESFTPDTGINVNVMLVDMSTLLQATLAGQGPDVALQVSNDLPMNYGLRNAVADLSVFKDLPEIKERFHDSAMTPFEFNGATYALPETQVFPMLFYRKDILRELGLDIPRTWDDIKVAMAVLSKNMMEFGMLPSEQVFATLLYQNGGEYYNEGATLSALDSDEAINAFKVYTEFYTDYKLDRATSIEERFRVGETPLIIADYTTYNNLQVSAPDLKGMWGFAPMPGTVMPDGAVNNLAACYGGAMSGNTSAAGRDITINNNGACIMMNMSKKKEASWEFMKWWTSAGIQTLFGREMESLMGSSARVPTANLEAFSMLPWPSSDYAALSEQFKNIKGIPQVPGGYFSYRNVNNAFYSVTTPMADRPANARVMPPPREELTDKVILINDEIRYKRIEFGLPLAD
ncbi:MAG: extracellular solute-binding protein [Oscillospiraceae bacterium]|nr:extracellular solute-binding protein [Oscillospiraceae bacterium]